jgi:squalene-associated FAD-dependent desaturase
VSARTAVVGGGLAGLTAALRLADQGDDVVLLEAKPRLGGLTSSFTRDSAAGPLEVDTGQHVFLRCCTEYLALLDRLGVADRVHLQDRLTIPVARPRSGRDPQRARLRRSGLPAPAHLAATLAGYRLLAPADRLRIARAALALRRVDPAAPATDARSFGSWLTEHAQRPGAVTALWDLIGVAALNAPADGASLALAATVFKIGLLSAADAADIGWSRVPLQELHGRAGERALTAAGARVRTGVRVTALAREGAGWAVHTREGTNGRGQELVDRVVLAVPPTAAEQLAPADAVALPAGWSARLGGAPIVNVHVVYDRPVLDGPFLAAVDSPVQWVFDRTEPSGCRQGQYVAVSLSAARDVVGEPAAAVQQRILPALAEVLPRARSARVLESFVTRERQATFDPAPGQAAVRPPQRTAAPGLVLAGAWTDTGWPATMEGAVRSGNAAVAALGAGARATAVAA